MKRFIAVKLLLLLASVSAYPQSVEYRKAEQQYNRGIDLLKALKPQEAIAEFEQSANLDPKVGSMKDWFFYMSNAHIAEAHYQIGVDFHNQKKAAEAGKHFYAADAAVKKAIAVVSQASTNFVATPEVRQKHREKQLFCYAIFAKNVKILIGFYGDSGRLDEAIKLLNEAEALDRNKAKWRLLKEELNRLLGRSN
jgi:tetratricopeptide (TPR) repeat protein